MRLESKLAEWQAQGFLTPEQAERIARHEAEHARPTLLLAISGLGALTIGIGLVSLVAANWDGIGRAAKLGVDVALLAGLAYALFRASRAGRTGAAVDALAALYTVLTLASIGLLGQTYQLGSPTWQALVGWAVLTAPSLALARGRFVGTLWLCQILAAELSGLYALVEHVEATSALGSALARELAAALIAPAWALPLLVAYVPRLRAPRPAVARAFTEGLWALLGCAGLALACAFYVPMDAERLRWGSLPFVAVLSVVGALLGKLEPGISHRARGGLLAALGLVACTGVFGLAIHRAEWSALVPLLHVSLLGCAAFVCLELGSARAFHALTGLVAVRVLIAYFEVFGSMLDTGLGMIVGGAFTLLVVWVWRRQTPALARRLSGEGVGRDP